MSTPAAPLVALSTALLLVLTGCARPSFVVPDAPAARAAPAPPGTPAARAVEDEVDLPVTVDGVRIPAQPVDAPARLAVLPVTVDEAGQAHMGTATALILEDRLPRALLEGGVSHFVGPDVLMQVPTEKQATRDGTVRWTAPLGTLMQVEPVGMSDRILALEVRRAQAVTFDAPVRFEVDPEQAATYAEGYTRWRAEAEQVLADLEQARAAYVADWKRAAAAYESRRGKYGGDEDEPTSGDLARAERDAVLRRLDAQIAEVRGHLTRTPSPEALASDVGARTESRAVPAFLLEVRARLVDARSLQVQWIADLSTRDDEQIDAVVRVLDSLVDGLRE